MENPIFRDPEIALRILKQEFGIEGELSPLPGELDANYKVTASTGSYLLKISKPNADVQVMNFECQMSAFLRSKKTLADTPVFLPNRQGHLLTTYQPGSGDEFVYARLLTWMEGRLWSGVPEYNVSLLQSLGRIAGNLTHSLQDFHHPAANKKDFDWDIAKAAWTKKYQELFQGEQKELIAYFYQGFANILGELEPLRKSVIHNDLNDNNLILGTSGDGNMEVTAVIDFGDSTYTNSIIDLAVCLTYAMMDKRDPLEAGLHVVKTYHKQFPLLEAELEILYWLIGARLVISLTKSKLNGLQEPENTYHQVSADQAWDLIKKWRCIDWEEATAFFRSSCGYPTHRNHECFTEFLKDQKWSLEDLLPEAGNRELRLLDLDISSPEIHDLQIFQKAGELRSKIQEFADEGGEPIIAAGYGQVRPDYITNSFLKKTNKGNYWECLLLGTEFWSFQKKEVKALLSGRILLKGAVVTIAHEMAAGKFLYAIYHNLNVKLKNGEAVGQHEVIGHVDTHKPLFLQFSLIEPKAESQRKTCRYEEAPVYKELFPDPGRFFPVLNRASHEGPAEEEQINFRKAHLGKSLSLSYNKPLQIVRGEGIYLISQSGRKYMDLVNNVAHVGHEHPGVVAAGQRQMAMLNTNSRYLHPNIVRFAENLLSTFPEELSVVHFVNSGSEANELALRMAKAYTGQSDFIALEVGYHGNTNACIDVSSYKFDGKGGRGAPPNTHIIPLPDPFRGKYRGDDSGSRYADHVREKIRDLEEKGRKPAAFIAESIISCGGQIVPPAGFFKEAYQSVRIAGGLCIADEVQIGCGRLGKVFWGFELQGVVPDIVSIGKPLGNGHPLGAVVCTQAVAEAFANGMEYFNTFGGNPVSCAIGNKVLDIIKEEGLQQNAETMGNYLKKELTRLQQDFPILADIRGQGLFLGVELTDQNKSPLSFQCSYLVERMLEQGFLMSTEGPDNNVLKIKPPLVFSKQNADEFLENLQLILTESCMQINN